MAGNIVEISDFIGSAFIQRGKFTTPRFDDIRDEWTNTFLYELLGAELGKLFIADLVNGIPQTQIFIDLYDAFVKDDGLEVRESKGIKDMIKQIIWFYYARNNGASVELTGNNIDLGENSDISTDNFSLVKNYNKGIDTAKSIQWFICDNLGVYPVYNGQDLNYAIPI